MDDDPQDENENSCEEEAEPAVDSEAGSKAVSSDEKRTCSICFKLFNSKGLRRTMKEIKDLNVWSVKDRSVPRFLLNITSEGSF